MRQLKQSTAANIMVFMTDALDHISGKTGLTLTITSSKDGGAFAGIAPTVTERGSGFYNIALTASMVDTLGDLALHVSATGADPTDLLCRIVAVDYADAAGFGLSRLDAAITSRADATTQTLIYKILHNKRVTDPVAGTITVYDDDSVTPLLSASLWKDAAGTQPYAGTGAERQDRMT